MKRIIVSAFVSLVFGLTLAIGAHASSHESFKGKTIRLVVGNSTGGAMDDWGRFVAHHLGRHIPGSPDVLVQNMPGAGAIVAANYIYNVAKPDGLTLGLINPANYIDQLIGAKEVKFDWPKFSWIGSPERIDQVLFMRTDVPYGSHQSDEKAVGELTCFRRGFVL
jgi:tripartite-type tricarboxylate transporter receptor subunit TctC